MTMNHKSAIALLFVAGGLATAVSAVAADVPALPASQADGNPPARGAKTKIGELQPCIKAKAGGLAPCVKNKTIHPCIKTKGLTTDAGAK